MTSSAPAPTSPQPDLSDPATSRSATSTPIYDQLWLDLPRLMQQRPLDDPLTASTDASDATPRTSDLDGDE